MSAKEFYQEASLHDWINNTGQGLLGLYGPLDIPQGVVDFIASQHVRFNVRMPPEEVIRHGAWSAFVAADNYNPYLLLCGISDVEVSSDWREFSFEELDSKGRGSPMLPEQLETFEFKPGQDEEFFNEYMGKPGLKALPYNVGYEIESMLDGDSYLEDPFREISPEARDWLTKECELPGDERLVDEKKIRAYFELSAWAAILWIAGPLGREFRYSHHEIFHSVQRDGEAAIYNGMIIGKEYYRKLGRPPQSCVVCGNYGWCVELNYIEGNSRFLCEKHLNPEPLYKEANCGSRSCRDFSCQFNPAHGSDNAMFTVYKERGQLASMVQKQQMLSADSDVKRISG